MWKRETYKGWLSGLQMSPATWSWNLSWKQLLLFVAMLLVPAMLFLAITITDNVALLAGTKREDQCPLGFFPCGNLSVCVAQAKQCDMRNDCPNGEDEAEEICNDKTALHHLAINLLPSTGRLNFNHSICEDAKEPAECLFEQMKNISTRCDLPYYPEGCNCSQLTRIKCVIPLYTFPQQIPPTVTRLFLQGTMISTMPKNLSRLSQLNFLQLKDNFIKKIPKHTFYKSHELKFLYLSKNQLSVIRNSSFTGLKELVWLFLESNRITHIETGAFMHLKKLRTLSLSDNLLTLKQPYSLYLPPNLIHLLLEENLISQLTTQSIQNAKNLQIIHLQSNSIKKIEQGVFASMKMLAQLNLSCNLLDTFEKEIFSPKNQLHTLALGNNPITLMKSDAFSYFHTVQTLNVSGITIDNISPDMFEHMGKLKFIYFKKFDYCRFIPMVPVCEPKGDGISSINNLLDLPVFRVCIWVVAFLTCCGNIFVMILRLILRDERNIHSLFIKNLCAADFTMGLYLIIVASHDVMFRDEYNRHAHNWMSSWCCQATGFLAMTSCEVSILLVTFMSIERCIRISFPYKIYTFNTQRAIVSLIGIWSLGILLALIPMFSKSGFGTFYGSNGVCFPLHIHDPFLPGWQYSVFVFVGVNFVAMIIVSLCYIVMFVSIRNSQKKTNNPITKDISFAKRFFLIVLTDGMCWIPIIVIKLLAFADISISDQFYAWLTIFVLPINSAINPIIYSVTTTTFRRKLSETFLSQKNKPPSGPPTVTTCGNITTGLPPRKKSHRPSLPRRSIMISPGKEDKIQDECSPLTSPTTNTSLTFEKGICPVNTMVKIIPSNGIVEYNNHSNV